MKQYCWRLRQLCAEGAGSWCLESSRASAGLQEWLDNETGQTDMGWSPTVHLPSVCLSLAWEHQNTVQKALFKYLRAFGQEIKGHVGLEWVNPLLPTDSGEKKVSLFAHRPPPAPPPPEAEGEGGQCPFSFSSSLEQDTQETAPCGDCSCPLVSNYALHGPQLPLIGSPLPLSSDHPDVPEPHPFQGSS